ncbi:MAG: DUF1573 domain-containing protein [Crocinitomix sp.]|nr:DUF1573 domain-containing protein [Crocinitomix sp.]
MKNLFFIGAILMSLVSCTSDQGADAEERRVEYAEFVDDPTSIAFDQEEYNFGSVVDGDMVKHTFKFTNTGDKNLVLFDVKTTCGCTVPEDWPKHPIAPGESGEVKVIFNSNNKVGSINKSIRIEANTNPTVSTVRITGEVTAAE